MSGSVRWHPVVFGVTTSGETFEEYGNISKPLSMRHSMGEAAKFVPQGFNDEVWQLGELDGRPVFGASDWVKNWLGEDHFFAHEQDKASRRPLEFFLGYVPEGEARFPTLEEAMALKPQMQAHLERLLYEQNQTPRRAKFGTVLTNPEPLTFPAFTKPLSDSPWDRRVKDIARGKPIGRLTVTESGRVMGDLPPGDRRQRASAKPEADAPASEALSPEAEEALRHAKEDAMTGRRGLCQKLKDFISGNRNLVLVGGGIAAIHGSYMAAVAFDVDEQTGERTRSWTQTVAYGSEALAGLGAAAVALRR